ncbi:adenylylsulfate reductase subunit B [Acetitomaculum ruminis DSM 5522]|uniref:Adenylylsulfate reductase subunit B n=1 Tax=Acetitomaculum ruminis DSM 5522 TaxID=1120918 RepID=A0A1I0ZFP4_9FIRM|nr:ferredoxin family protein [Acetitomaculum ruminis]SFB23350.1 adenylylsulfate reductase subunit B [Acetitomaculum ruminis DSM 5522]
MSIRIDEKSCVGCKKCVEVCPGNLIKIINDKACIKRQKDCWGCTSCIKECKKNAIKFFLGADIGGKGSLLSVEEKDNFRKWIVTKRDGSKEIIVVNMKESNKY